MNICTGYCRNKTLPLLGVFMRLLGVVLGNAFAVVVHPAEVVLGIYITLFGKWSPLSESRGLMPAIKRCQANIKFIPRRSCAKQRCSDDGEWGGYAAHG